MTTDSMLLYVLKIYVQIKSIYVNYDRMISVTDRITIQITS